MLRRDEQLNLESCWNKAREDEYVFVLLGRDVAAPAAIRAWIEARIRLGKNEPGDNQLAEAESAAKEMAGGHGRRITFECVAKSLRSRAQRMQERAIESDAPVHTLARQSDNAELIMVLARILEGVPVAKAFGAPGDWGYGTPIGDALAADYRG